MFDKYENGFLKNIDIDNVKRIINFLEENNCNFIDELLEDYLDLFTFDYNEFVDKFNKLNMKYNNNFIELVKDDTNLLEEFYN